MDRAIDFEALTPDQLEQVLGAAERQIAKLRWLQVQAIRSAIRRQVPLGDGCRTTAEWIRGRVDTTPETARSLEAVADLDEAALDRVLEEGVAGFDRVAEAAKASSTDLAPHLDIAGMRRVGARRHRVTRDQEIATHGTRSVSYQRDLFGTVGHLRADGPAMDTDRIYRAIRDAADRLPNPPRPEPRAAREFDGLLALALDSSGSRSDEGHDESGSRPWMVATVIVDAAEANSTNGESGVWTATGSRVGPNTLERILCDGVIELTAVTTDGTPLAVGTARSAIPPRTRRYVLARDGGCVADGCTSMTRLQPHHIKPRSRLGSNDPENLATLCWFHHHVVVHGRGFRIDPDSPAQRRRFLPPDVGCNDPP
jgi:hypothetical protein